MQNTFAKFCCGFNADVHCKNVHLATKPRFGKMHKYGDRDRTLYSVEPQYWSATNKSNKRNFFFKCFVYPP